MYGFYGGSIVDNIFREGTKLIRITAIRTVLLVVAFASFCAVAADNTDMNTPDAAVDDANSSGVAVIQEDSFGPGFCGCDFSGDGLINFDDFARFVPQLGMEDCWITNDWCDKYDLNHNGFVDYLDIAIIAGCWVSEDTTAPTPDPMQWDRSLDEGGFNGLPREIWIGPNETFDWGATMRADPNSDDDTGLEFYFHCTNLSGFDSGWISFPDGPPYKYTVMIGSKGWLSQWRVRARDRSINKDTNVTGWSTPVIAE